MPVGLIDLPIDQLNFINQTTAQESVSFITLNGNWVDSEAESLAAHDEASGSHIFSFWMTVLLVYLLVSAGLFIRLIRIVHRIQLKAYRNEKLLLDNCEIVLLNDDSVPHTFFNQIFLNKKSYLNGEVPEEVMIHEMTHARQKHTLDILLVESLKIIFWFNPLLYLYKKAILLNHEFLADEAVLSQGISVKEYQTILLEMMLIRPANSLTSTLNYSLTKKRLQMMTQSKSTYRSLFKILALIPLVAIVSLLPGCDSTTTELSNEVEATDSITIEIVHDDNLLVNGSQMNLIELENYLSELTESPDLVNMTANSNIKSGVISEVQNLIRKHEVSRIHYFAKKDKDSNVLTYPPASSGTSEEVKAENLIQISIDSQGYLLINEKTVEFNEVKENIKHFVKDNSTNSTDVIIIIKTEPNTPYGEYLSLLDEVTSAYSELMDEAAHDQFGTTFSKLEENSSERKMINEMYQVEINVRPPIQD
jgi:biopolymer transport protein ExbD